MTFYSHSKFRGNAASYPANSYVVVDAVDLAPFFNWLAYPIYCGEQAVSAVVDLFMMRGPSAISRLIVSVIIFAINRFVFEPAPHIRKEVFEGIHPAITYSDASATIIRKGWRLSIQAPILHALPGSIFWANFFGRMTVRAVRFFAEASARCRAAIFHVLGPYRGFIPAFTQAQPHGAALAWWCFFNRSESSEGSTSKVDGSSHYGVSSFCDDMEAL